MRKTKREPKAEAPERQRMLTAYRMLINSIREVRNRQTVLQKERQMRRLMRFLQRA